jgi:hypothetical protein
MRISLSPLAILLSGYIYAIFLNYPNLVFAESPDDGAGWTVSTIVSGSDSNWEALPTAAIDQFGTDY